MSTIIILTTERLVHERSGVKLRKQESSSSSSSSIWQYDRMCLHPIQAWLTGSPPAGLLYSIEINHRWHTH